MSHYDWEAGTFTIPAAEWASLKKVVREAHNREREHLEQAAQALYQELRKVSPSKRGAALEQALKTAEAPLRRLYGETDADRLGEYAENIVFASEGKLVSPTQARINAYLPKATNKTLAFECGGEACIAFSRTGREVVWRVGENNHACEMAHEHPTARAFFAALRKIKWTRGSGGTVAGNDENNRDCEYPGGGENYVKFGFGPLHETATKRLCA